MDIFAIFTNYLLTIADLFGYVLGMRWGERKNIINVDNFWCACGCDKFLIPHKDHLDKDAVITCERCGMKYRNDGAGPDGKLQIFRQEALSDEWELDDRNKMVIH